MCQALHLMRVTGSFKTSAPAWRACLAGADMLYFIIKGLLSGVIISVVFEVARRSPTLAALIVSLPLVSLLCILWLWRNTKYIDRITAHAESTFWYVLPSLPMFLVLPAMLRAGIGFWSSLGASCLLTMVLYLATAWTLAKFGRRRPGR
jgi:hypothetical protein